MNKYVYIEISFHNYSTDAYRLNRRQNNVCGAVLEVPILQIFCVGGAAVSYPLQNVLS